MVDENGRVSEDMKSEILVLESPRETRFCSSAGVVGKKKQGHVLAHQGLVHRLCFVAGQ